MENNTTEKAVNGKAEKTSSAGYPFESIPDGLAHVDAIVADSGSHSVISREEISASVGKKVNTLGLYFSTWVQYGMLEVVRGAGYKPTPLYKKYSDKTYDHHELEAKLEMFNNVPLYKKIIENLNNQILPNELKFQNILKEEPYNVNANSAKVAAKIFFENAKHLGLINRLNKFSFSLTPNGHELPPKDLPPKDEPQQKPPPPPSQSFLTLQVPMSSGVLAEIKFPKEYTDDDLDLIAAITIAYKKVKKPQDSGSKKFSLDD